MHQQLREMLAAGLIELPSSHLSAHDRVIGPELEPYAFSNQDDIIILTETFKEYLVMLERVLARIRIRPHDPERKAHSEDLGLNTSASSLTGTVLDPIRIK